MILKNSANNKTKYKIRTALESMYDVKNIKEETCTKVCTYFKKLKDYDNRTINENYVNSKNNNFIKILIDEYDVINDYYNNYNTINKMSKDKVINELRDILDFIKDINDYMRVDNYVQLCSIENSYKKIVETETIKHPMWTDFFKDIKGCSPFIAGNLIAYLDVHRARSVSSFWSYCGIGKISEDGIIISNLKRYNEILQDKLLSVLVPSILRNNKDENNFYVKKYLYYKDKYSVNTDNSMASKAHVSNVASMQCAKRVLADMWTTWRQLEGYPVYDDRKEESISTNKGRYTDNNNIGLRRSC